MHGNSIDLHGKSISGIYRYFLSKNLNEQIDIMILMMQKLRKNYFSNSPIPPSDDRVF